VIDSVVGNVKGFIRRFYQGSTDHRGTPGNPGRVVTLLPSSDPTEEVWGIAYRIPEDKVKETLDHLDYREKGGFTRSSTTFYPQDCGRSPLDITVYVAIEGNVNYLGPAPVHVIARTIAFTRGPSGPNVDYLFNLCEAMRKIAPEIEDEHLTELESAVRHLIVNEDKLEDSKTMTRCTI